MLRKSMDTLDTFIQSHATFIIEALLRSPWQSTHCSKHCLQDTCSAAATVWLPVQSWEDIAGAGCDNSDVKVPLQQFLGFWGLLRRGKSGTSAPVGCSSDSSSRLGLCPTSDRPLLASDRCPAIVQHKLVFKGAYLASIAPAAASVASGLCSAPAAHPPLPASRPAAACSCSF